MEYKCGISYQYFVCVQVFSFICKCRPASHELHNFFKESKNILKSFCVIYYKCPRIILIVNFFCNLSIHLQNKEKNAQNSFNCQDNTMCSQQGSTCVRFMVGYKHIGVGTTAFKASIKLSEVELCINGIIIRIWLLFQIYKSVDNFKKQQHIINKSFQFSGAVCEVNMIILG